MAKKTKPAAKAAKKAPAKKAPAKKSSSKKPASSNGITAEQEELIEKHIGDQVPQHLVHRLDPFMPDDRPGEIAVKISAMQQRMSYYPEIIEAFEAAAEAEQTAGE